MGGGPLVKELGAKLVHRVHPDCANETYDSDEYWKCYIRANTLSFCHPVSTNRMGPTWDKNSVVDPRLRYVRLSHLRIGSLILRHIDIWVIIAYIEIFLHG